jgi:hypothetical protein
VTGAEAMSATAVLVRSQAKWIRESAEAWWREDVRNRMVRIVEMLIPPLVNMTTFVEELVRESWEDLRRSPATHAAQEKGEELAESFSILSGAFDAVEKCLSLSEAAGYRVEGAEAWRAAHAKLLGMEQRFRDGWPMLDVKAAEAASARIAAGKFVSLEDLGVALDTPP